LIFLGLGDFLLGQGLNKRKKTSEKKTKKHQAFEKGKRKNKTNKKPQKTNKLKQ